MDFIGIRPQFEAPAVAEMLGRGGATGKRADIFLTIYRPMKSKRAPEVKPWVRRVAAAAGVEAESKEGMWFGTVGDGEVSKV